MITISINDAFNQYRNGQGEKMATTSKQHVLKILQAVKPEIVERYRVKGLEIFGSVVRGEHHEESDIDVLVEFSDNADMFDLVGLGLFLEEKLNRKVDIVSKRALRSEIQSAVLAEAIAV